MHALRSLLQTATIAAVLGAPLLLPGSAAVDGNRLSPGTDTLHVRVRQGDQRLEIATMTQELTAVRRDGRPAWLRVQRMVSSVAPTVIDSAWVDRATLAPIERRSHDSREDAAYSFRGRVVDGSVRSADGSTRAVSDTFDVALFDSNPLDLVVRALPLEAGYAARIAAWEPQLGGRIEVEARVVGEATVEAAGGRRRDAWIVEIARGDTKGRLWVGKEKRDLLRQESEASAGIALEFVRP